MKNSNIQWIGEIPDDWEVTKIGQLYQLRNQKVSDRDFPPLSVTMNGIVPQMEHVAKTNAHDDRKLVKKGDFAINSRSDRRGSCGISKYDGSVSLINTVLQPLNEMNPNYYDWLFHTVQFADEFYKWGHGIVDDLWSTNWQDMKNISVCVPPLATQTSIADYLDAKCSEIDGLIADINKQIETLNELKKSTITEAVTKGLNKNVKLKDSGIQWIGEIPEGWSIKKVKHISFLVTDGAHITPDTTEEKHRFVSVTDMDDNGNIDLDNCLQITDTQYSYLVKTGCKPNIGDVLISKDGTIGKTTVVDTDIDFVVSSSLVIIRPNCNIINPYYFRYNLMSKFVQEQLSILTSGSALKRVSVNKNANLRICYSPSLAEQHAIATYLDTKCTEFDSIISDKQMQISTLEAYKKSLIYEYVTGKKEVG